MQPSAEISEFGITLLWILGGVIFILGGIITSRLLSPHRPNPEKLSTYECGEDPVGNAQIQINMRFYVVALIFLIFDVEIVFLFPWATVFADAGIIAQAPAWGWFAFAEVIIFAGILLVGLAYVWQRGDLDWVRPDPVVPPKLTKIPAEVYQEYNGTI